jgi:hypothetical protein
MDQVSQNPAIIDKDGKAELISSFKSVNGSQHKHEDYILKTDPELPL